MYYIQVSIIFEPVLTGNLMKILFMTEYLCTLQAYLIPVGNKSK